MHPTSQNCSLSIFLMKFYHDDILSPPELMSFTSCGCHYDGGRTGPESLDCGEGTASPSDRMDALAAGNKKMDVES